MLLRRYIGRRLSEYYAQPSHEVVGSMNGGGDINFKSLLGEWHWKRTYRKAFRERRGHWLTPVELFRPHYSRILANFIAAEFASPPPDDGRQRGDGVHIVEFGGGRGTNANLILSRLREAHPDLYDRATYTLFDSSPSLHELQREEVVEKGEHGDRVEVILVDLTDVAEGRAPFLTESDVPTFALALELLDNLPHDKVTRCKSTRKLLQAELRPARPPPSMDRTSSAATIASNERNLEEIYLPLTDPLLTDVLEQVPSYAGTQRPRWVPTVACGVLRRLFRNRPNSGLLLADFDYLPPPDLSHSNDELRRTDEADGEPLVTDMNGADHVDYLGAPPLCDILYPTDFGKLSSFVRKQLPVEKDDNLRAEVHKQGVFLKEFDPGEVRRTESWLTGYSPLVEDFGNCSMLTVSRKAPMRRGVSNDTVAGKG